VDFDFIAFIDDDAVVVVYYYYRRSSRFRTGFIRIRGERGTGSDAVVFCRRGCSDGGVDIIGIIGIVGSEGGGPEKEAKEGCAGGYGKRSGANPGITGVAIEGIPEDWRAKPRV
jgi:hypothetical protein